MTSATHLTLRSLTALGATGLAALVVPAISCGAVIGVQDDRLASAPLAEIPGRLDLLGPSRTKVTRIDILWHLVASTPPTDGADPADPAYDWSRIDAMARGLADGGIVPIVTVFSAPSWATGGRQTPAGTEVNPFNPAPRAFADFMEALVTRYTGRYRPPGAAALPAIRHFEIWNEPNIDGFFKPQTAGGRRVAVDNYLAMLRAAYPAMKQADPRTIVIAGVGGPRSSTGADGTGADVWLDRIAGSDAPFDAYSQHVYPAAPPLRDTPVQPAWASLPDMLEALDRFPRRRGMEIFVTEAGYTTASTPFRTVKVSVAQQALYLRQIAGLPVVRSSRIPAVVWFNLQDNPSWPGGLLAASLAPKPSYNAFRPIAAASVFPRTFARPDVAVRVSLTPAQLRINQRISQAAVRRANRVQAILAAGLTGADVRPGGLGAAVFGPGVTLSGAALSPVSRPLARSIVVPDGGSGSGVRVKVSARQLLVNQRISQAAVRRSNALAARLAGRLTGGDVRNGSLGRDRIAAGLTVAASAAGPEPAPSRTEIPSPGGPGGRVALTAAQLLVNQRISQAAVLRTNALLTILERGLRSENFAPGSITSADLAP